MSEKHFTRSNWGYLSFKLAFCARSLTAIKQVEQKLIRWIISLELHFLRLKRLCTCEKKRASKRMRFTVLKPLRNLIEP